MPASSPQKSSPQSLIATALCVLAVAAGISWIFWSPLWHGGGLIGGDLYPYYFPQKAALSDSLQAGEIPLWNPLVGFGYPTLGESQTGVLYPPNLWLYSQFSLNSAYNISQLLHYCLAFVATWGLARQLGISAGTSMFVSLAFVYGWFPARICLEWAIIGGAWFVVCLWMGVYFIQTGRLWSLVALSAALGVDLLAGHYNLAFITLMMLAGLPFLTPLKSKPFTPKHAISQAALLGLAIACGFLIAGVQLLPSWELKSLSQRQEVNEAFSPTYGNLPPTAISQLWQPWSWYASEVPADQLLEQASWLRVPNATNQVEAFLYCGLLTVVLVVLGCVLRTLRTHGPIKGFWSWMLVAVLGLVFATGWPTHYLKDVPGIGFFRGPGRYSMVTALALSILAGSVLDALLDLRGWHRQARFFVVALLSVILAGDLWSVSRQYQFGVSPYIGRQVFYATLVDNPPVNYREQSQLKSYFQEQTSGVRLYAPGQNVPTMLGVSAIPVYLGIGPEIYETDQIRVDFKSEDAQVVDESMNRMRNLGVTHLLLEHPIDPALWGVTSMGEQFDELLNRAFGRREPYYLYEVVDAPGRASLEDPNAADLQVVTRANSVSVMLKAKRDIPSETLTLRDLNYPGWSCRSSESQSASEDEDSDALFRTCKLQNLKQGDEVEVRWQYRPKSVFFGLSLSAIGILLTLLLPTLLNKFKVLERLDLRRTP